MTAVVRHAPVHIQPLDTVSHILPFIQHQTQTQTSNLKPQTESPKQQTLTCTRPPSPLSSTLQQPNECARPTTSPCHVTYPIITKPTHRPLTPDYKIRNRSTIQVSKSPTCCTSDARNPSSNDILNPMHSQLQASFRNLNHTRLIVQNVKL